MHVSTSGGPPALWMARLSIWMVCIETRLADGCTLKSTELPAEIMPMALQMMVEVGLVTGVMAPITPNGAGSVSMRPRSPERARGSRISGPGVRSVTTSFLMTLSSVRPRPVSSKAN